MPLSHEPASLWLVIPAWRRSEVTAVCLPQLAWACEELTKRGVNAYGVVIADDENLDIARAVGFAALERPNQPLGKKWNDGFEYACRRDADYVVACGTDNWIDPLHLAKLPIDNTVAASRCFTAIREDGQRAATITVDYDGGDGIRIIPTELLRACGWRPAGEMNERAIDTSIWRTLNKSERYGFTYRVDPLAIVGFQSVEPQLNAYDALLRRFGHVEQRGPWNLLRSRYPERFVAAAEAMYAERSAA